MKDNKVIIWSIIEGLEEIVPPQPAKKYIPEWYKKAPPAFPKAEGEFPFLPGGAEWRKDRPTIKVCPSVHDWFSQGYVIPMWADLRIEVKENGEILYDHPDKNIFSGGFMSNNSFVTWLPEHQKKNAIALIKPNCPWRIKTPAGYSCYQFPMWYHFNPDFEVPPGPIWSDEYHLINPQLIIKRYGEIKIKRGTPLCVFVPYKREPDDTFHYEVIKRNEECKILERKTKLIVQTKFTGGYKEMQKEKGGCPMHKEQK